MKIIIDLNWLVPLFDSNFFTGLATILTGVVAYLVYIKQKRDNKQKIARVIYIEVKDCENIFTLVKRSGVVNLSNIRKLPITNSWDKNKYLFANDFDDSEISMIDIFFGECKLLNWEFEEAYNLPSFWKEKSRIVAEKHAIYSEESDTNNQYESRKNKLKMFEADDYFWQPNFPLKQIIERIKNIDNISTTVTGAKLKRIAQL